MTNPREQFLLADIGATNARFALLGRDGVLGPVRATLVASHPRLEDAIERFLAGEKLPIASAVLAVAGPVDGNRAAMTNSAWTVDGAALCRALGVSVVRVINDFEATAWALPSLRPADLFPLGGGSAVPDAPMVVLGPGTGLGVACYAPGPGGGSVIPSEGGHSTMPGTSAREDAILGWLRERFGHASAERVVSGQGLENLYHAVAAVDRAHVPERTAVEITQAGIAGTCPTSRGALDLFCAMLGTFAGNAALTFGARGGAFIAGGIAPRIVNYLAGSDFRARFEAKGRLRTYAQAIPSNVIVHPDSTFVGLKSIVERNGC